MRATMLVPVLLSVILPVAAQTGCQTCSAPGGDCSKAYKGGPGVSCGEVAGNSFCCPSTGNALAHPGGDKCHKCADSYRCFYGNLPSNICGERVRGRYSELQTSSLVILVLSFLLIGMAVSACMRHRRQLPLHAQGVQGMQMQQQQQQMQVAVMPGQPMHGAQPGMPVGTVVGCHPGGGGYPGGGCYPVQSAYPAQSGYGGGTVAAGAGMGFLGGMMVSNMMHDGGGYGGGGYGDGGGGYGGGDMGGGDMGGGDFSADM